MDTNFGDYHLSKDEPPLFTLYPCWVCLKYPMYWPINHPRRKTLCRRALLLGLLVQMNHHFSSRFSIDSHHEPKLHSWHSETQWFERNAFVVSSTGILNVNPEVHIQHVAENFDHSVRPVVTSNTFHVMEMIISVPLGGKVSIQVPCKIVRLQDIEAVSRVDVKYLNWTHKILHLGN